MFYYHFALLSLELYCVSIFDKTNLMKHFFQFLWQYMDMVSTLLSFIRAQREGNWQLHVATFREMLLYFFRYDHTHYARWGAIYLMEMHRLPDEVKNVFKKGD